MSSYKSKLLDPHSNSPAKCRFGCALRFCAGALLVVLLASLPEAVWAQGSEREEPSHLTLRREGGERVVLMQDLFEWLSGQFPDFKGTWDPIKSEMRIQADGAQIVVYGERPVIDVNREPRKVPRAIMLRRGRLLIPVATVKIILETLGFEADLGPDADVPVPQGTPGGTPPAATPVPPAVPITALDPLATPDPASTVTPAVTPDIVPALTPAATSETSLDPAATPLSPTPAAETPMAQPTVPVEEAPMPSVILEPEVTPAAGEAPPPAGESSRALQPPPSLAGKIGLSWGQLADVAHRQPPRDVTIVYDQALAPAAQLAHDKLADGSGLNVTLVEAPSARRDSEGVIGPALGSAPQLLVDLMLLPVDSAQEFHVWTVHDALWPQDRQAARNAEGGITLRYRNHQFQNLALGSLLRSELGAQFPDGPAVLYELSPAYLLRRANAPSAAVLVPASLVGSAENDERVARAVFAAISGYIEGMRSVQF